MVLNIADKASHWIQHRLDTTKFTNRNVKMLLNPRKGFDWLILPLVFKKCLVIPGNLENIVHIQLYSLYSKHLQMTAILIFPLHLFLCFQRKNIVFIWSESMKGQILNLFNLLNCNSFYLQRF